MLKEQKNHVGRPTNEEVSERKKKKAIKIVAVLVVILVLVIGSLSLLNINTNRLKGSKNGTMGCFASVKAQQAEYKNGNMVLPVSINCSSSNSQSALSQKPVKFELKRYGELIYTQRIDGRKDFNNTINFIIPIDYLKPKNSYSLLVISQTDDGHYQQTRNDFSTMNFNTSKTTTTAKPTTKSTKTKLMLRCPSSVMVNKVFSCETNVNGAVIKVTGCTLKSGYRETYTTNTNNGFKDMTKQTVCTKTGEAKVQVFKSGFESTTLKVKKYSSASAKKAGLSPLTLKCPSSVKVGKEFKCDAYDSNKKKVENVKFSVTYSWLEESYRPSVKTGNEIRAKYTKPGNIIVIAEKNNYVSDSKVVKITK